LSDVSGVKQDTPITLGVIPYFPKLIDIVPNITSAVLVTYLEMRNPAPQDHPAFPVTVSAETVCRELRITRRTLALTLYALSRVFQTEEKRHAAARGAREFTLSHCTRYPKTKIYSLVTDYNLFRFHTLILRRNTILLREAFLTLPTSITSGDTCLRLNLDPSRQATQPARDAARNRVRDDTDRAGAPMLVSSPETLSDILLKASVLSGDRRSERYPRLRKAVASGLEDRKVLSAKQPKKKTTLNTGVQPDLPDDLTGRLARTKSKVLDPVEGAGEGVSGL